MVNVDSTPVQGNGLDPRGSGAIGGEWVAHLEPADAETMLHVFAVERGAAAGKGSAHDQSVPERESVWSLQVDGLEDFVDRDRYNIESGE
mgnify:CR=1 FL=1